MLQSAGDSVSGTLQTFTLGNVFVNVALVASFKYLWKMLDALQLVVYLPMISILLPGNAEFFFRIINDVINLKMIDVGDFLNSTGFSGFESKEDQITYKMKKGSMVANLGIFFVLILSALVLLGIFFLLSKIFWQIRLVQKLYRKVYKIVFYSAFLRSFL